MKLKWIVLGAFAAAVVACLLVKAAVPIAQPTLYNFDRRDFIIDDSIVPAVVSNIIKTVIEAHAPSTPGDEWYLTINNTNISLLGGFFNPTTGYLPVKGATNWLDSPAHADSGSLIVGSLGSAVNRSTNYLYIPISAGTPVGTPVTEGSLPAIVYDSVNDLLYAWNPATSWHVIGTNIFYVTGAVINPTDWKVPYRVNATTFGDTPMHPTNTTDMWFDGSLFVTATNTGDQIIGNYIHSTTVLESQGAFSMPSSGATVLFIANNPNQVNPYNNGYMFVGSDVNTTNPTERTMSLATGNGSGQLIILENRTNMIAGVTQSAFSLTNGTPQWDDPTKLILLPGGDWKPTHHGEAIWLHNTGLYWHEIMRVAAPGGGSGTVTGSGTPGFLPVWISATGLGDSPIKRKATNAVELPQNIFTSDAWALWGSDPNATWIDIRNGTNGNPSSFTGHLWLEGKIDDSSDGLFDLFYGYAGGSMFSGTKTNSGYRDGWYTSGSTQTNLTYARLYKDARIVAGINYDGTISVQLPNGGTTNRIGASAGLPTWNGAAWPGGGNFTISGSGSAGSFITWATDTSGYWTNGLPVLTNYFLTVDDHLNITSNVVGTNVTWIVGLNDGLLMTNNIAALNAAAAGSYIDVSKNAPATITNLVSGAVSYAHATNGVAGESTTVKVVLPNGSGDQTLTINANWRTNVFSPVPTTLTNNTITVMYLEFWAFQDTATAAKQTNCAVSFSYFK